MTTASSSTLLDSLSALNGSARLRILRLVSKHELSVGEVADILQLPQSTASRHLKPLHNSGFVARRTVGTTGLYRLCDAMSPEVEELWNIVAASCEDLPQAEEDAARMNSVLAQRHTDSRHFFQTVGIDWESMRKDLFGSEFTANALLCLIDPSLRVVDIGSGIGNAASLISHYVSKVIAVDREVSMLDEAKQRPDLESNIEFLEADAMSLPLEANSADVALFCLVLHHLEHPEEALREAARIISNGGRIIIIDMQEHQHQEYKHTMGHVHLGFSEADIRSLCSASNISLTQYHRLRPTIDARGPSLFAAVIQVDH